MRKLMFALLSIALLGGASAVVARGNGVPRPVANVQMQCNTMVGVFEVDAGAARAALPARYELALQPNGSALVYLQASNCDGSPATGSRWARSTWRLRG